MKTLKGFITVLFFSLLLYVPAMGQDKNADQVYTNVDQMPEYPGGMEKLMAFVSENVVYPEAAKKEGIQGKIFVSFTIDKKGEVVNAEIAEGVHPALDAEALRVVKAMPSWSPGKNDGQVVNVRFTLPVQFKLKSEEKG